MKKRSRVFVLAAAAAAVIGALGLTSCRSVYERRDPTGEVFPTVTGSALSGEKVELPSAFRGEPVVLLVGYEQQTQFDLDRWILGLTETGTKVRIREIPTIPGLVPGLFGGFIDSGMRRGIPSEDWGSVITLYSEAEPVARFTGTRDGLPGRILLLDGEGRVVFFHDRGYSAGALARLREALARL